MHLYHCIFVSIDNIFIVNGVTKINFVLQAQIHGEQQGEGCLNDIVKIKNSWVVPKIEEKVELEGCDRV